MAASVLVGVALLPMQLASAPFGPVAGGAEAREMDEFGPAGRQTFFVDDRFDFWVEGTHSGLDLRARDGLFRKVPLLLEYAVVAGLLPVLWLFRRRLPSARQLSSQTVLLPQLLAASLAVFLVAHLLLFKLYLPNRYVKFSVPLVLAVAAALAVGILAETLAARLGPGRRGLVNPVLGLGIGLVLVLYPARYLSQFERDPYPAISQFVREQPKEVLVAGAPGDVNALATFTGRSVLASYEAALPYHLGYYEQVQQRLDMLMDAYYTRSPQKVLQLVEEYEVDFLLVNRDAYHQSRFYEAWTGYQNVNWEPYTKTIARRLRESNRFALLEMAERCALLQEGKVAVVPASCVRETASAAGG